MACAFSEGEVTEQHVFVRGNPDNRRRIAPKRFPLVLASDRQPAITTAAAARSWRIGWHPPRIR